MRTPFTTQTAACPGNTPTSRSGLRGGSTVKPKSSSDDAPRRPTKKGGKVAVLQAQITRQQEEIAALKDRHTDALARIEEASEERTLALLEVEKMHVKCAALRAANAELQKGCAMSQEAEARLRDEHTRQLNAAVAKAERKYTAIMAERDATHAHALSGTKQKHAEALLAAEEVRVECADLRKTHAQLQTEYAASQTAYARVLTENAELYAQNTAYRLQRLAQSGSAVEDVAKVEEMAATMAYTSSSKQ